MTPEQFLAHTGDPLPAGANRPARALARHETYRRAYHAPSLEALARLATTTPFRLAVIAACRDRDRGTGCVEVEWPEGCGQVVQREIPQ